MLEQLKLTHLHQKLGDDEAVTAYNKAIELNSRYSDAWSNKGNAPCQLSRFDEALKVYEYAISIDSNDSGSKAWEGKGDTLVKLRMYDEAIKVYDKAIEINPHDSEVRNKKNTLLKQIK